MIYTEGRDADGNILTGIEERLTPLFIKAANLLKYQ
jgi:hypothetical protein